MTITITKTMTLKDFREVITEENRGSFSDAAYKFIFEWCKNEYLDTEIYLRGILRAWTEYDAVDIENSEGDELIDAYGYLISEDAWEADKKGKYLDDEQGNALSAAERRNQIINKLSERTEVHRIDSGGILVLDLTDEHKYEVIKSGDRFTIATKWDSYSYIINDGICEYYYWDTWRNAQEAADAYNKHGMSWVCAHERLSVYDDLSDVSDEDYGLYKLFNAVDDGVEELLTCILEDGESAYRELQAKYIESDED